MVYQVNMMKNESRTEKAIINVIVNVCYQVVNTIANLILPPLIIGKFGSNINGLISTIKQLIGYIQLVGAGISESSVVSMYKPLSEKNHRKISAIFNASSKCFFHAGVIFSVLSGIVAIIYPFFIDDNISKITSFFLIIILCMGGASEFFVIGKCRTLLIADQKFYIVNVAQIIGSFFNVIITVVLIKLNASIVFVQIGGTIIYIMRIFLLLWYVKKNYSFLDKKIEPDMRATEKKQAATVHQLAGLITFGSQTIIVSVVCGLAEGSVYSVYNLVFTGISTLCSTVSSALLASFGELIATESKEKLNKVFRIYECLYFSLIFIFYSVAFILIIPFIKLYTSHIYDANYIRPFSAALFCLMGFLNCLRTPGATLINAIGHYKETQYRSIIEMLICFFGEVLLVKKLGINGVLIGTILAYGYRTIDVIIYSNLKVLNTSVVKTLKNIMVGIVSFIIFITFMTLFKLNINNYFQWIFYGVICTVIMIIILTPLQALINKKEMLDVKIKILELLKYKNK